MTEICPLCGLPRDLCICADLPNSYSNSTIRIDVSATKNSVRTRTIIYGLTDDKAIASKLKRLCGCGGTCKGGKTILQGNHRFKVLEILHSGN